MKRPEWNGLARGFSRHRAEPAEAGKSLARVAFVQKEYEGSSGKPETEGVSNE
ncbi:MAG: hypothetical protein LKE44_00790 [Eubacterium sp.]|nr:hypothetical protein [Eubacterium sp.]